MKTQLIVNRNYRIELLDDGIITVDIVGHVDRRTAVEMVAERKRIAEGKDMKVLIKLKKLKFVEQDALNYLGGSEADEGISAGALVHPGSVIVNTIINAFMGMKRSNSPTKMFRSTEEAIKWLKDQ